MSGTDRKSMSRAEVERLVRDLHRLRATNDVTRLAPFFTEDIEYEIVGAEGDSRLPRRVKGVKDAGRFLAGLMRDWGWRDVTFHYFLIEGETAAVRYTLRMEYTPLQKEVTTDFMDIMTFKNGKIAKLCQFSDTAVLNGLMAEASA